VWCLEIKKQKKKIVVIYLLEAITMNEFLCNAKDIVSSVFGGVEIQKKTT